MTGAQFLYTHSSLTSWRVMGFNTVSKRFGICSSADTLARSIQYRVQEHEKGGPVQDSVPSATTVISADNIDILHSYAQVFWGKPTSSWRGTTVQAVQPIFSANYLVSPMHMGEELCCLVSIPHNSWKEQPRVAGICSPCSSPFKSCRSPKPKVRWRARTGLEGSRSHVHHPAQRAVQLRISATI